MHKNAINWKRTWFGSIMEILLPIFLMMIIVWARSEVDVLMSPEIDIYQIKKPFFPTAYLQENGTWTDMNYEVTKQGFDMIPFMEHNTYFPAVDIPSVGTVYEPLIDPLGPFYFFPPHCYERKNGYSSPIVAYIP